MRGFIAAATVSARAHSESAFDRLTQGRETPKARLWIGITTVRVTVSEPRPRSWRKSDECHNETSIEIALDGRSRARGGSIHDGVARDRTQNVGRSDGAGRTDLQRSVRRSAHRRDGRSDGPEQSLLPGSRHQRPHLFHVPPSRPGLDDYARRTSRSVRAVAGARSCLQDQRRFRL